ncbi:MAG TPA: hypothetical protein VKT21_01070 [Thermoplasmata archaeon]|nr:hypothetical protein [Thermoplasmata archaeon]
MVRTVRSLSRAPPRRGGFLLPALCVSLVLVFLAPYGLGLMAQARGTAPAVSPESTGTVNGVVYWNGVDTTTAPNPSSAISWSFSTVANVRYVWTGPPTGTGVSQAFLVVLFLGFPAYTKQEVQTVASGPVGGTITMTYDLTQFKWYLQGVYELHAYLENPAGNSLWSETFYVRVTQPYDLVVATVGLLLLTVAELYMIATVGARAADRTRRQRPRPPVAPPSTEDSTGSTVKPPETP